MKRTPQDLEEFEKFKRLLQLVADGMTKKQAYAEIYGEVVFDTQKPKEVN